MPANHGYLYTTRAFNFRAFCHAISEFRTKLEKFQVNLAEKIWTVDVVIQKGSEEDFNEDYLYQVECSYGEIPQRTISKLADV